MEALGIPTGLQEVGPWGLLLGVVAYVFLAITRGHLVTKAQHEAVVGQVVARAELAETTSEKMGERLAKLTETNNLQARAIDAQASVGDTVTKLVNAIQEARTMAGGSS